MRSGRRDRRTRRGSVLAASLILTGVSHATPVCARQTIKRRLHPTEYLVLDFHQVTGVDATAVRTCFLILRQKLEVHGVTLIFTGMAPPIAKLMRAQGVLAFEDDELKLAGGCGAAGLGGGAHTGFGW